MNKKVDNEFIGIKDVYTLQCICTELKGKINEILDIADKEKVLVEERWSSSGEHKEFYEITFDYGFLKSILVGSDKNARNNR